MQLGMVGLGRMGANLVRRLMQDGHDCVVYDVQPEAVRVLSGEGATGTQSLADLAGTMARPRAVWVMVPAGEITQNTVSMLAEHLEPDDVVIDGGNSYYRDDVARAAALADRGIHYVDVGTSGGVWGRRRGYCLMIGGEDAVVERLRPIFRSLAPGVAAAERTPGREGPTTDAEEGFLHCGPTGAGHFVKMVHNGIEYGIMASYAEGLNILEHADAGLRQRSADAETAPLDRPEFYRYQFPLDDVAEVWRRGSVIQSWLLDLAATALLQSPDLEEFSGRVSDSGEGRWTAIAAVEEGVPAPTLASALFSRFGSRDLDHFANQVLSAMRKGFGGHAEKPERVDDAGTVRP
jgi:6-phosphogluconate dehydrogenase